ncbi:MAG: helix-turn-helix transcriptional regulator, partial [Anaerolineae bacterium]|nr:helix-turn-helix transcriptional regulator [Anaerolineae bacterium]
MIQSLNDTLLATKLHPPPLRRDFVPRQRLTVKLNHILESKLTLITAPAGFGKTTLIREWVEPYGHPIAWLSLDERDNSPARFLLYLIHAFRQIEPALGSEALGLLNSIHLPQLSTVLTHLTNDLAATPTPRIIILDDYHLIEDQTIHQAMDFLLAHGPAHTHLVIASRSQPPLSLARLRGQAQLLELNSADLRFTAVEVEQFLKQVMQLDLPPAERIALEMRTEGWIAGLQLAGLSLQGQENKSAFIASFSGDDRHIGDYLFEEVLQHQSDQIQRFLLFTSVADKLCGSLCDAILGESGSQTMLERLDDLCLFIAPLDQQRQWYRYHPLFSELLRHQLSRTQAEQIPLLHRRASLWFEQHDRLEEAIGHGLRAADFERTADLIETAFQRRDWIHHEMRRLLAGFEALPEPVTQGRPKLKLSYAWLLFEIFADQWGRIEALLRGIEMVLVSGSVSEQETQVMLAEVDLLRANHARQAGEPARVIELCQQALGRLPDDETYRRSGIIAHLASAYESLGQMAQANQIYTESMRLCRAANNLDGLLFAAARLIEVLTVSGRLRQAERVFGQMQDFAAKRTGPDMGLVYINIGEVYRERNRLEQAKIYLNQGLELCRPFEAWHAGVTSGVISLARLLAAEGFHEQALKTLLEIEKQPAPATPLEQARLASIRARLLLAQGDYRAAAHWARRSGLSASDEVDYAHEFDYLTLVRVLIAQAALEAQGIHSVSLATDPLKDADNLLDYLYTAAQSGGRLGRIIELHMLQALTRALRHDTTEELHHLEEALSLAEPEGYVRLFADEGWPLYQLLTRLSTKPLLTVSADYMNTVLAA